MEGKLRNVLVISSVDRPVEELRRALGDDVGEVRVVVPPVNQSRLAWLTNDEDEERKRAERAASSIADALPAERTEATAGDPDPVQATKDALREFPADEVVVVTRPDEDATWLEEGSGEEIERELGGIPVTRITVPGDA
jgi:hypothetical protein